MMQALRSLQSHACVCCLLALLHGSACSSDDAPTAPSALSPDAGIDGGSILDKNNHGLVCDRAASGRYSEGTQSDAITVQGKQRTFRVHIPPGLDRSYPAPLVLMLHGGGGSGRQFEEASADMDPIADREHFVTVYPDGTGTVKAWNAGTCCGSAAGNAVDDVAFIAALLDRIHASLCIDRARVFASGMSNGAMLSHRLGCELADQIAAIAPVSGTLMAQSCSPSRPVAIMHIHGSADGHVPWDGGEGCGPAGVPFTSVPDTIERWRNIDGCDEQTTSYFDEGNGHCEQHSGCATGSDVVLCEIDGSGHSWPGGQPPAGLVACPANGPQSASFHASEVIWRFLSTHPLAPH